MGREKKRKLDLGRENCQSLAGGSMIQKLYAGNRERINEAVARGTKARSSATGPQDSEVQGV